MIGTALWYNGHTIKAIGYRRDDTGVTVLAEESFNVSDRFPLKEINNFAKKIKTSRSTLILSGDAVHVSLIKITEKHDSEGMLTIRFPQGDNKQLVIEVAKEKIELYQKIHRLRSILSGVEIIKRVFLTLPDIDKKEVALFVHNSNTGTLSVFNNKKLISLEEIAFEGENAGTILNKHFHYLRKRQEISLIDSLYVVGIDTAGLSDTGIMNIKSVNEGGIDYGGIDLSDVGTLTLFLLSGEVQQEQGIYERFKRGSGVSLKSMERVASFLVLVFFIWTSYLYINTFLSLAAVKKRHLQEVVGRVRDWGGHEIKDIKLARMMLSKIMHINNERFPYTLPIETIAYRLNDDTYINNLIFDGNKIAMTLISEVSGEDIGQTMERFNKLAKIISSYPVFQEMMSKSGPQYRDKKLELIVEGRLNRNIGEDNK